MRKLFLILAAVALLGGVAFADATATSTINGRNMTNDKGVNQGVAIVDASNGYTANVDSRGAVSILPQAQTITSSTGTTLAAGVALVDTACRVSSITCGGFNTAAGGYVLIYDAASAAGTPAFECSVGTAKDTQNIVLPIGGAQFNTGVFADSDTVTSHIAITYDR